MKFSKALFTTTLIASTSLVQSAFAQERAPLRAKPAKTTLEKTVEKGFAPNSTLPVLEVFINEKGPFRMVVDTGSQAVQIDDDVVAQLGTGARREVEITLPGSKEPIKEVAVPIKSLVIGDATFSDFEAIVVDFDKVYGGTRGRDGTLGFSLFRDCLLSVDYHHNLIRLETGSLPIENDMDILPYMPDSGVPTIESEIQFMPHRFVIDTGRAGGLALPEWIKDKVKLRYIDESALVRGRNPRIEEVREVQADGNFRIGNYRFVEPPVHFYGEESAIGGKVLNYFVLTFDQKFERVRFGREDYTPIDFLQPPKMGMYIQRDKRHKLRVLRVEPDSPAANVGIQAGDEVLNVNGKPAVQWTETALRNLLDVSDSVDLQLSRDGYAYILRLRAPGK